LGNTAPNIISPDAAYALTNYQGTSNYLLVSGDFSLIKGSSINGAASCLLTTGGIAQSCSNLTSSGSSPNNTPFTTSVSANNLYIGGLFDAIGNFSPSTGGHPVLALCSLNSGTGQVICNINGNALGDADINFQNGTGTLSTPAIRSTALDNAGNIFVVGEFGNTNDPNAGHDLATTSSQTNINLVARCKLNDSSCSNLLSGLTTPNLDGTNDVINAMATNVEITSVSPN
jgi:hypothetical protein